MRSKTPDNPSEVTLPEGIAQIGTDNGRIDHQVDALLSRFKRKNPIRIDRARRTRQSQGQTRSFVYHGDARVLSKELLRSSVDVTITSPPYFDLKDYGVKNQIGFGQSYDDYLRDLAAIFKNVLHATKDKGSLWIIVDTFRRDQEVFPLPFDLASKLKEVGWILRDVIIWKKERTVPWAREGSTKKIFEYILVFAKTRGKFNYFLDAHRDIEGLRRWWVKYPERYNPRGKALEEIWAYDIPTQGSWGRNYIRHFCPLPNELVQRIVALTTTRQGTVLDPFAGTGTVPTQAHLLGRRFIGFELNRKYIQLFEKHIQKAESDKKSNSPAARYTADDFSNLIKNLRILKYARLLLRSVQKLLGKDVPIQIHARAGKGNLVLPHHIYAAEYCLIVPSEAQAAKARSRIQEVRKIPPLSKFGISDSTTVICRRQFSKRFPKTDKLYGYTLTNSHSYKAFGSAQKLLSLRLPLVSNIALKVQVPDE